jgi:hypothetical protein
MTDSKLSSSVWTTLDVVGFHYWPDAPGEVEHLASRHRHLFKIRVGLSVSHADRAIEFQLLKRNTLAFIETEFGRGNYEDHFGSIRPVVDEFEFGTKSCEMIAQAIIVFLIDFYPSSYPYEASVSEDGESGAMVRAEP